MKLTLVILALIISGCGKTQTTDLKYSELRGEFRSRPYMISEAEHVTVFEIPSRPVPIRCWVWTDGRTSQMHCDDDAYGSVPNHGPELER